MRENRTNTGRPSWRARPRESEGREQEPGRHAASPAEGKDHGAGVEAEGEMWQRRRLQLRQRDKTRGKATGPRITDRREGEGASGTGRKGKRASRPRGARAGRGSEARQSPVLFEKLVRLPKAVVEQHVDAGEGQLRVLQGRRRRVSVVPPPRPLLLRASHGRARLCAGPRRGGVAAAAAPARARSPALPARSAPERARGRGAAGGARREEPGSSCSAAGDVGAQAAASSRRGDYSAAARPSPPRRAARAATKTESVSGCLYPNGAGAEPLPPPLPAALARRPGPSHRAPRAAARGQRAEPARTRARPLGPALDPLLQMGRTRELQGSWKGQTGSESGQRTPPGPQRERASLLPRVTETPRRRRARPATLSAPLDRLLARGSQSSRRWAAGTGPPGTCPTAAPSPALKNWSGEVLGVRHPPSPARHQHLRDGARRQMVAQMAHT